MPSLLPQVQCDPLNYLGVRPRFMRPPYGSINERVKDILQRQLNYTIILWNLDSNDWRHYRKHPTKIYASFVAAFSPNNAALADTEATVASGKRELLGWISLQHDLYEPTLLQQEDIIGLMIRRNLKIVPLLSCIGDHDGPAHQ